MLRGLGTPDKQQKTRYNDPQWGDDGSPTLELRCPPASHTAEPGGLGSNTPGSNTPGSSCRSTHASFLPGAIEVALYEPELLGKRRRRRRVLGQP